MHAAACPITGAFDAPDHPSSRLCEEPLRICDMAYGSGGHRLVPLLKFLHDHNAEENSRPSLGPCRKWPGGFYLWGLAGSAAPQQQEAQDGPDIEHDHRLQGVLEAGALDFANIGQLQGLGGEFGLDGKVFEPLGVQASRKLARVSHVEQTFALPAPHEARLRYGHRPNHVSEQE